MVPDLSVFILFRFDEAVGRIRSTKIAGYECQAWCVSSSLIESMQNFSEDRAAHVRLLADVQLQDYPANKFTT